MRDLVHDLAYATRTLLRSPRFTGVAVMTLALGIGGVTVMFSLVRGILLDPLPFPEPDRLVRVFDTHLERGVTATTSSPANFMDWREQQRDMRLAAWNTSTMTYTGVEPAEPVAGALVTAEYFSVLGVSPMLGRAFSRDEETWGNHHVVILGHGFWQRQMGGDRSVVGRSISLEGVPHVVAGVMPEGFAFPTAETELWRPLAYDFDVSTSRGVHYIYVIGRLDPGATLAAAESGLQTVMARLTAEYPERLEGWGVRLSSLQDSITGDSSRRLLLMFGAVGFVLLIAVVNVANLTLARALSRSRELAVRLAMGARRWHLARQLVSEGLVLSLAGAVAGLGVGWTTLRLILPAAAGNFPRLENVTIDGWVAGFALLLSLLLGIALGLAPVLGHRQPDLHAPLKEGGQRTSEGRGRGRLRAALVVAQVSLAIVLAVGATLLLRSYGAITAVDPGYAARSGLVATIGLPGSRYPEPADRARFFLDLVERLEAVPGVRAAAVTTQIPLEGYGINFSYWMEHEGDVPQNERPNGDFRVVSPGYFQAMGIPVLRGREFTRDDTREHPPVIVIDEALARRHFGSENPVGRRMVLSYGDAVPKEIIGVVGEVRQRRLELPTHEGYYVPVTQESWSTMRVVLATQVDPVTLETRLRQEVAAMDPLLAVLGVRTLEQRFEAAVSQPRLNAMLLGLFAVIAGLLAAAGIYSVLSYIVARRTHEIGLRMALGARRHDVRRQVVTRALRLAAIGILLGLAGALGLTRLLSALLFGVSPTDPLSFVAAAVTFGAVAVLGSYLPARRASTVDPLIALRSE